MADGRPTERWFRSLALTAMADAPFQRLMGVEVELIGGKRVDALYVGRAIPEETLFTIVEVKRDVADAKALVQLLGYMSRLRIMATRFGLPGVQVGGVLAAPGFTDDVVEAVALRAGAWDGVQLYRVGTGEDGPAGLDMARFAELFAETEREQFVCDQVRDLALAALQDPTP